MAARLGHLITCPHWKILFDCGWHRDMSPDGSPDRRAQIRSLGSLPLYITNQGRLEKGAAIDEQLAALGIKPSELDMVLLSHLDCDHANGLKLVSDAKQILVSEDELRFARNHTPVNLIRYNPRWWRGTKIHPFEWNGTDGTVGRSYDIFGDGSLVMINIPGHSKGLCALKITNPDGRFCCCIQTAATRAARGKSLSSPASPTTRPHSSGRWNGYARRAWTQTASSPSQTMTRMLSRIP